MSIFGFYFTSNLLNEMGWPKEQGLLRKKVIDTVILDSAVDQMIDWAASIGAGRPRLALQIIAYLYNDRDWSSADAPDIKAFMDNADWETALDMAPHEVIESLRLSKKLGPTVEAKLFASEELRSALEQLFMLSLLYGLGRPYQFELWYSHYLREYKKMGLNTDTPRTLREFYSDSETIIRNYERDIDNLPTFIPTKLLEIAQSLERDLTDNE